MDACKDAQELGGTRGDAGLRILYASAGCSLDSGLARAEREGFAQFLIPPPFPGHVRHGRFLARSFDDLAPAFAAQTPSLAELAARARGKSVSLLMDVRIDRLSARSPLAGAADSPFHPPDPAKLLDPRRNAAADEAQASLAGTGDAWALVAWWVPRLLAWQRDGLAGFRLLGLDAFPGDLAGVFFTGLRQALPEALLLVGSPGLAPLTLRALQATGVDGVFTHPPGGPAGPSWDELAALAELAPVIATDALPGASVQAAPGYSRALAPLIGQGFCVAGDAGDQATHALREAWASWPAHSARTPPRVLASGPPVMAFLRLDAADHRAATVAALVVVNTDASRSQRVAAATLLPATGGVFGPFQPLLPEYGDKLGPESVIQLKPNEVRVYTAEAVISAAKHPPLDVQSARAASAASRLAIEYVTPAVDEGLFPVKAIAGELVSVEADIVFDGHEKIAAALRWRCPGSAAWQEVAMRSLGNDRWQAAFPLAGLGRHTYAVCAWRDRFETFRDELAKKSTAGVKTELELLEGAALVRAAGARAEAPCAEKLQAALATLESADAAGRLATLLSPELAELMAAADDRPFRVVSAEIPVDAERIEARFASWYEVFPRSLSDDPARHGTFRDVERHLPRIRGMGFDVLYFPPIHPIGRKNRKGRNNSLTPAPEDPGSPYAIGAAEGGHDVLHPELGTLEDFGRLRQAAAAHGLELAMDFAIQCSPDHPWLRDHPGWFDWRPDGTIRYAENPPKKYEDIVNVDFYTKDAVPDLWLALCDVVLFWAGQGVRLFRVDNPHTKPFPFWQWMIGEVRGRYPDAIFLAEAFTRPKVMYRLAKIGFSQSYTYFTWRNSKRELEDYLTELDTEAPKDFFRPHFFVNTPDINPVFLQTAGRPGFLIRAALASTLSGLWGVYNGFELCEAASMPGKEEYLDSEKYQLRAWDWDRPGNIVAEITQLNRIRRENPALQTHLGVRFHVARNDAILYFEKATPDRTNVVLVAVSLDPYNAQEADFEIPLWSWNLPDQASLEAEDLQNGTRFTFHGKNQHLRLTPEKPYAIWRVTPT